MNLLDVIQRFSTDEACRKYLEEIRWPNGITCPKCGHDKIVRLKTRKQFTCAAKGCRHRFSATAGTIFHKSHIPLTKWFLAIYLMSDAKKGVSSLQIHRELKISQECCWHLCHRIREAMREDTHAAIFRGIVQVDDYYHGGCPRPEEETKWGRGTNKHPIMGAYEKETGKIRTAVMRNMGGRTVLETLAKWLDLNQTELHTDEWGGYRKIGRICKPHKVVCHGEWYVSKDGTHVNGVENVWSLFARSVMGAFHKISVKHLPRYLGEFDSRFNARLENGTYFPRIIGQSIGRRLPLRELIGTIEPTRTTGRRPK